MLQEERVYIEMLYRTQYTMLMQLALRKTENKDLSEDLVQSVFIVACIKSAELLHHPNPVGWLVKTMQFLMLKAEKVKSRITACQMEYYSEPTAMIEPSLDTFFLNR